MICCLNFLKLEHDRCYSSCATSISIALGLVFLYFTFPHSLQILLRTLVSLNLSFISYNPACVSPGAHLFRPWLHQRAPHRSLMSVPSRTCGLPCLPTALSSGST